MTIIVTTVTPPTPIPMIDRSLTPLCHGMKLREVLYDRTGSSFLGVVHLSG